MPKTRGMNFTAQLLDAGRSEKLEVLTCYCTSCEHNSLSGLFIALSNSSFLLLEISCDNNSVNTTWNRLKLFQCQPYERPRASESRIPQATKGSQLLCISPLPTGCTVFLCWGLIFFFIIFIFYCSEKNCSSSMKHEQHHHLLPELLVILYDLASTLASSNALGAIAPV